MRRRKKQSHGLLLAALMLTVFVACARRSDVVAANDLSASDRNAAATNRTPDSVQPVLTKENRSSDQPVNDLDKLLASANWQAVEEARRQGSAALSVVRRFSKDQNYVVRQITMNCVEAIGDAKGGDILAAGLSDENVNVRLAAARALATRNYPIAASSIVAALEQSDDDTFRELLAKAAGLSSEQRTISVLTPLSAGDSVLAQNAVLALAKLGSETGRKMLSARLSAKLPRTRYEALEGLCYVNDKRFSAQAKRLLSDKAVGLRIGSVRNPQYRRVADQAVDSLVCFLGLRVSFAVAPERIYSDQEIASVRILVK